MKKALLLSLAAASVMLFALPAVASAKSWEIDNATTFEVTGHTTTTLTTHSGDEIKCSTASGTGAYTTKTTGNVQLTFHGCSEPTFGVSCTTAGQSTGTIKTTALTFHNIYATHGGKEIPSVLITPNAGHFASFGCTFFGIGAHVVVSGTGVIGEVETCGKLKESHLNFVSAGPGTQTLTTWTGTTYDLKSSRNGAAAVTASRTVQGTSNSQVNPL